MTISPATTRAWVTLQAFLELFGASSASGAPGHMYRARRLATTSSAGQTQATIMPR